jgi:cyanophycin synthetase
LLHPWTEIAICEAGAQHILSDGLGFDRCSVGVVLNVGDDHLGHAYTDSIGKMAEAKRCIVDVVLPDGTTVLNADDPLVAEMGDASKGAVLYFTLAPENPVVAAHVAAGGKAVWLADGGIVLAEGDFRHVAADLTELHQPGGGEVYPENVLAAIGAAWAHGRTPQQISQSLLGISPE